MFPLKRRVSPWHRAFDKFELVVNITPGKPATSSVCISASAFSNQNRMPISLKRLIAVVRCSVARRSPARRFPRDTAWAVRDR